MHGLALGPLDFRYKKHLILTRKSGFRWFSSLKQGELHPMFDIDKIREDFPILAKEIHGKLLIYLDNAATTQKPKIVLDKIVEFYANRNSNIHRGVHYLSEQASYGL